jgi:hypothetical protein
MHPINDILVINKARTNGAMPQYLFIAITDKGDSNMEHTQITKSVIDFQKMSFNTWYNAACMIQDQAVSTMDTMLNQASWIPEEGRNSIHEWVSSAQEERNRFKEYVDKGFQAMEKAFVEGRMPQPGA